MLERHTELIERLLRGSLTRTSEFNEGWSFTNDGTLYFSVWDEWSGLVLWAGCFEGCWLLLVVLCPLARVLVG